MRRLKCSKCGFCKPISTQTVDSQTTETECQATHLSTQESTINESITSQVQNWTTLAMLPPTATSTTIAPRKVLVGNVTQIVAVHVSFARQKRQNTVHNTSYGMLAVNIEDLSDYAQASYVDRLEYEQLNFKMTFNIQNGTDLDMLAQSVIEKCALVKGLRLLA